ncbi:hypothetical protein HDU96_007457 [Phlyctochytrium bullatum]|nr:hypothetical protein HDU96_007457 [Phlyctochytrium bullatum]
MQQPLSKRMRENFTHVNILAMGAVKCHEDAFEALANPGGYINLGTAENKISGDLMVEKLNQPGAFHVKPETLLYGSFRGSAPLRGAVAKLFNRRLSPVVPLTAENVLAGNGAGSVINILAHILADPGDVVLIPSPVYGAFFWDLRTTGRVESVFVPGPASVPSLEDIEAARAKCEREGRTVRAILITNPGNPSGQVLPRATVRAWLRWAAEHKLQSIVDEVYAFSVWAQQGDKGYEEFESVLQMEDLPDRMNTHVVWSFSKDLAMSGMRAGALITYNTEVVKGYFELCYFHGIPNVVDEALARLLDDEAFIDQFIKTNNERLRAHWARVEEELDRRGIPFLRPNAGIFAMLDLSRWTKLLPATSKESANMVLFERLLKNKVYISPAEAFFAPEQQGWFRIIHTSQWEVVEEAVKRIFEVLNAVEKEAYGGDDLLSL